MSQIPKRYVNKKNNNDKSKRPQNDKSKRHKNSIKT